VIYFLDPGAFGAIFLFFALLFFALLFTFSLLFANSRQGMMATFAITLFLFLSFLGVGNFLNLILIVAIAICIELYLGHK